MIAWAEASVVAVIVAAISLAGVLLGGVITRQLQRQDRRAEHAAAQAAEHRDDARIGIAQILSATDANTRAIGELQTAVTTHLTHHLNYEKALR